MVETFRSELEKLINRFSMENGSNTPDFLLADYLNESLKLFDSILRQRADWKGHKETYIRPDHPPVAPTRNVCKHRRTSRSPATGEEQCLDCLSYIRDGVDPRAELLAHASKRDCPKCLQRGWVFNEDRCSLCGATGESTQDDSKETK